LLQPGTTENTAIVHAKRSGLITVLNEVGIIIIGTMNSAGDIFLP
jgi:hypothetical protein